METTLFGRFAAWATALRHRIWNDPFRTVRYQLMGLYLLVGIVIFMLFGWFLNSLEFKSVYQAIIYQTGTPAEEAFTTYHQALFKRRAALIVLFIIATYYLTEFALRPVKKSAELQKHFIGIVSHELRTPLTIMKNMSEVALRNPDSLTHEKAVSIIESNLEETNRLSETVQFLLTFSLMKERKTIPDAERVSLAKTAERVLAVMERAAAERSIRVTPSFLHEGVVEGNSIALEGFVVNLVKNAIQHTPDGGEVTVSIDTGTGGGTRLSVSDTGPGIPKEDLPYIFEPFFRGRNPSSGGFGLGLSIARQVAELHRATVDVKTARGEGTTFTVSFPA